MLMVMDVYPLLYPGFVRRLLFLQVVCLRGSSFERNAGANVLSARIASAPVS